MWKSLPGVSKSKSKWNVDTRESNKAYDATKRKRTFQPHWLQMYKWLHFDGESQLISCDWCKQFGKYTFLTQYLHISYIQNILRMQDFACNLKLLKIFKGGMPPNPLPDSGRLVTLAANTGLDIFLQG
jgi:hypothetical protein